LTIRASEYFIFNNEYSTNYGVKNCNIQTGLQEEIFTYSREIISTQIKGKDNPYLQYIKPSPLKFNVTLFFEDNFDFDKLNKLVYLLNQPYYVPMIFSEDLYKVYYVLLSDDSNLNHNCLNQGYVTLTFICNSPYSFSPIYKSQLYDLSSNPTYTDIEFVNSGFVSCTPELYIKKVNNGDFSIINLSDVGKEFKFTSLIDDEEISVNNEHEIINTSLLATFRYDNFNMNFLSLPRGRNILKVTGTAIFYFQYQFKFLS